MEDQIKLIQDVKDIVILSAKNKLVDDCRAMDILSGLLVLQHNLESLK